MPHVLICLTFLALLLGPAGCQQQEPPVDFEPLARALMFVGVCTVLSSLIWGVSIVKS